MMETAKILCFISFTWIVQVTGSITWYEPPPVETTADPSDIRTINIELINASTNKQLSWNFSLTADLNPLQSVGIFLGVTQIVNIVPVFNIAEVVAGFEDRFNFTWINSQRVTLIIFKVTKDVAGDFACQVNTLGGGSKVWKRIFRVTVVVPAKITHISGNQTVTCTIKGYAELYLNCSATGEPAPNITWTRLFDSSVVTMPLINIRMQDGGGYRCTADNGVGLPSFKDVFINVQCPPNITSISSNQTVIEGAVVQLNCTADGNPDPTPNITWTRLSDNSIVIMPLTITGKQDEGGYRCTADNGIGNAAFSDVFITVQCPPNITSISSNQTVIEGAVVRLNCSDDGNPNPTPNITWTRLSDNNIVIMPLTITGKQDEGRYRCTADNGIGNAAFSDVFITVQSYRPISTVFSTNLPNNTVNLNDNFTLKCNADAEPVARYRLYREQESLEEQSNGTYLTFVSTRTKQVTYRCIPFNSFGDGLSKTVNVTVHYNPDTVRLVANATENRNCSDSLLVNFTCNATEANPPVENYQLLKSQEIVETSSNWKWIRNISSEGDHNYSCSALHSLGNVISSNHVTVTFNVPVEVSVHVKSGKETLTEGGNVSVYCGASAGHPEPSFSWLNLNTSELIPGQWLTFINISKEKAGDYICNASNTCGEKQSSVTTIDVQYKPENVHLSTSSRKICAGKMVILTCSAGDSNPAAENFTLYKNGHRLANVTRAKVGVFNQMLYTEGQHSYRCVASNAIGNATSSNTIVEVEVPVQISVHVQSGSETLSEGGNVSVDCRASGYAEATVTWTKLNADDSIVSRQWLNFTFIRREDSGEYICNANNTCGKNQSSVRTIDVQYKPENVHLNTSSRKICAGKMVILTCSAGDSNPAVENFTLYKNGLRLANVTRAKVGVFNQMLYAQGQHRYSCVASNAIGNASSNNTIVEVEAPASVTVENHTIVVREGDTVTLHCMSSGFPRPNVFWVNNSNYIMEAGNILNLTNISRHNREYNCSASNACGSDNRQVYIDVQYAAEATGRGGNYSVREGSTELFSCPVDGNPEPSITWYKGSDVTEPGISNAKQLEAGETGCYTCSAINGLGPPVTITQCLVVEPEEPTPTGQPTNQVYAELPMMEEFVSEYRDLNNQVSKKLVASFVLEMDKVYQNDDNYIRTEVTRLRSGSVIVSFILYFKNSVTPSEGVKELQAAISNGTLGTYQVGNLTLLSSGVSTFTTTPRTQEPTDHPTWIIIVAVAGGVVLLALVVAFVTWWVHKKRKCIKDTKIHNSECEESLHGYSPHASVNRAYAESGPPSANGSKGAAQEQSQDPGAIPTYAVVDKSKKKKKAEEKPPIYASVDKSKKRKKKTDDKNLYDSVEEPKKEKKPGEVTYAELGDFQKPAMPKVSTSPETLPPLKRAPSYEQTQYADITAFLKGDATLPQKEGNEGSEMQQQQSANQSQHDVDNKETPM